MENKKKDSVNKSSKKNKQKVLSVRLSYEDYGKLFLECDTHGGNFTDHVRAKLTRDIAAEAIEQGQKARELDQLR